MARPERPVDPADGPVQGLAAELRLLRSAAGNPSYRELARTAHYSKATLSAAANGRRLPTWDVLRAYVEACGGDVDQWRLRWTGVRAELGLADDPETPSPTPPVPPQQTRTARRRRRWPLVAAGAVLVVSAVTVQEWVRGGDRPPTTPTTSTASGDPRARFVGGEDPVADGADPKRSGCAFDEDVSTVDSIELNDAGNHFLGVVELRHSPACRVAWGRFTPSDAMGYLDNPSVTVTARRPSTGTRTTYETYFDGQAVFGNILLEDDGCVEVTVEITLAAVAPEGKASATTNCLP